MCPTAVAGALGGTPLTRSADGGHTRKDAGADEHLRNRMGFGSGGLATLGQLGPDRLPVVRAEVATCELAVALLFDTGAVDDRNAIASPLIDRGLVLPEASDERRLKALAVEERGPMFHDASMVDSDYGGQVESSTTVLSNRHINAGPYASGMAERISFGFGARLKKARKDAGISGEELGKRAGEGGKNATKQSVSDWEAERHYPKADQIRVICLKLNISADELILGDIRENAKIARAQSALESLTPEQRAQLLRAMTGPAASDARVGLFIDPAPPHALDSDFSELPKKRGT